MAPMSDLLGGDHHEEYRDFVDRYEAGEPPYDGISEEEAWDIYREVVPELSGEDYRDSAREIFSGMPPEERAGFGRELRDEALQQGYALPGAEVGDERLGDPDYLAQLTERVSREKPNLLGDLLDEGNSGLIGGMMGSGMTGGEGASTGGGMMGNPAAKTFVVGMAARGIRKALGGE